MGSNRFAQLHFGKAWIYHYSGYNNFTEIWKSYKGIYTFHWWSLTILLFLRIMASTPFAEVLSYIYLPVLSVSLCSDYRWLSQHSLSPMMKEGMKLQDTWKRHLWKSHLNILILDNPLNAQIWFSCFVIFISGYFVSSISVRNWSRGKQFSLQ